VWQQSTQEWPADPQLANQATLLAQGSRQIHRQGTGHNLLPAGNLKNSLGLLSRSRRTSVSAAVGQVGWPERSGIYESKEKSMKPSVTRLRMKSVWSTAIAGVALLGALGGTARAQDMDYGNFKRNIPGTIWYEFIEVTSSGVPRGYVYVFSATGAYKPALPNLLGTGFDPHTGYLYLLEGQKSTLVTEFRYFPVGSDFGLFYERQGKTIIWSKYVYDWQNGYLVFIDWSGVPYGTPWQQANQYQKRITWFSINSQVFRQYILPMHFPNS
jgi:hypothetical protein